MDYLRRYTGVGDEAELLCLPCTEERERGAAVETSLVCQECFDPVTTDVAQLTGIRGKPEIRSRLEPFLGPITETTIPGEVGAVIDAAPIHAGNRSSWLLLSESGAIHHLDAGTGDIRQLAVAQVPAEPEHQAWTGHALRRRLHASRDGRFAAVVNDYGRHGRVIDLTTGNETMVLDGGDYHPETVPFSLAFADIDQRLVVIHRTAWNRLDLSDPRDGTLLSPRNPTSPGGDAERDLDYFHGALHVSPQCSLILSDGWVWHPVGIPRSWSLRRWLHENPWESEDGASKATLCQREYYWDHAIAWIDERRVAIGGIGDDDVLMVDGARIFDATSITGTTWPRARELTAFHGPAGAFFSDGSSLYSVDNHGVSRWNIDDCCRTGYSDQFQPTHYHRGAGELLQIVGHSLVRSAIGPRHACPA